LRPGAASRSLRSQVARCAGNGLGPSGLANRSGGALAGRPDGAGRPRRWRRPLGLRPRRPPPYGGRGARCGRSPRFAGPAGDGGLRAPRRAQCAGSAARAANEVSHLRGEAARLARARAWAGNRPACPGRLAARPRSSACRDDAVSRRDLLGGLRPPSAIDAPAPAPQFVETFRFIMIGGRGSQCP